MPFLGSGGFAEPGLRHCRSLRLDQVQHVYLRATLRAPTAGVPSSPKPHDLVGLDGDFYPFMSRDCLPLNLYPAWISWYSATHVAYASRSL